MKFYLSVLITIFYCLNAQAYSNFIGNPYTLYPPACLTLPDRLNEAYNIYLQSALYGDNAIKFYEQEIPINESSPVTKIGNVILSVYRVACAETDRSVILLEFRTPDEGTYSTIYSTPDVVASMGEGYNIAMEMVSEPNTWAVGIDNLMYPQSFGGAYDWEGDVHSKSWFFVLENMSPLNFWFWLANTMSPSQYNGSFSLILRTAGGPETVIDVPPTSSILTSNPSIPLSGRLSGTWVADGAADQGFVISIDEVVPDAVPDIDQLPDAKLNLFLSWYTFDSEGQLLWLTGAQQFGMGATEVTIPIERVTNGQFMGSRTADREIVGSVTITGNNCNDLTFEYTLDDIGLASGTTHLRRIFSLETAGYTCRDLEARIQAR